MNFTEYLWFMSLAEEESLRAKDIDEVPIGAVVVSEDGVILSKAHNLKEETNNPCGHAEILALEKAGKYNEDWRLEGATVFVTLEPCPMCLSAMVQARIKRLVFGAYDSKGGALSLGYDLHKDERLNHRFSVIGGIKHYQCSRVLSQFFREKRKNYQERT